MASSRAGGRLAVAAPVIASFLLAIGVHLLVPATEPQADAKTYSAIASGIARVEAYDNEYDRGWSVGGLAMRGYAYPLFVSAVYAVTGGVHPDSVQWVQAVVFLPLTTFLIYIAGREAFSHRLGLIAAWLFALWLPAAWHTFWLLTETMLDFLMALLLALLAAALARGSPRLMVAAGLTAAVLSISHSAYQLLWIVLAVALVASLLVRDRRQLELAVVFVLGALVIVAPYGAYTITADLPRLGEGARGYGGGGGWSFYIGSRWQTGFQQADDDLRIADLSEPGQLVAVGEAIDRDEIEVEPHLLATIRSKLARPDPWHQTLTDRDYYRAGLANMVEKPSKWPRKVSRNVQAMFTVPSDLRLYKPDPEPGSTWFRPIWRPLGFLVAALAATGMSYVLARRRDRLVLFVPVMLQLLVFIVATDAVARYTIPLWSSLCLLASVGLAAVWGVSEATYRRLSR
jgi:4-amino-4-deoxy-L-arabinose transferase-like glycosyltransferase